MEQAAAIRPRAMDLGYGLGWNVSSLATGLAGNAARAGRPVQSPAFPEQVARMWYAIEGFDGADVLAQRTAARPEHLARLHALRDAGRLLLAGPCPAIDAEDPGPAGFTGSHFASSTPSTARESLPSNVRSAARIGTLAMMP